MKIVDYEILVDELIPPIGGVFTHYAKIQFLVIETAEGSKKIDPGLGEVHGRTEGEARAKMQKKFDAWVKDKN